MPGRDNIRQPDSDKGWIDAYHGVDPRPEVAADPDEYLAGYRESLQSFGRKAA
jgi:hypothetical protein